MKKTMKKNKKNSKKNFKNNILKTTNNIDNKNSYLDLKEIGSLNLSKKDKLFHLQRAK